MDRRRGRASGRRAGVDEIEWVIEEFRTRYFDFTAKHFHEAIHGRPMADGTPFSRGYTWTKSVLQLRGLVSKAPKRSAHRKKRARRPLPGLLLFQDGSKHAWLPQGPELDLVVTLDDATSAMLSGKLLKVKDPDGGGYPETFNKDGSHEGVGRKARPFDEAEGEAKPKEEGDRGRDLGRELADQSHQECGHRPKHERDAVNGLGPEAVQDPALRNSGSERPWCGRSSGWRDLSWRPMRGCAVSASPSGVHRPLKPSCTNKSRPGSSAATPDKSRPCLAT